MSEKKEIKILIEAGKATAGPPVGSTLGPLGLNVAKIVADINEKTKEMAGMQVPVRILYDPKSKEYEIKIGTPPASALVKKEAGVEKGSGSPHTDFVADLKIEQVIKIAKVKEDSLSGKTLKEKVKEIGGTCDSMGIMIEGKRASEAIKDIENGKYDKEIKMEKTELSAEELKELEEEKKKLQEEIEKRRHEFEAKAKEIIANMKDKERGEIKAKLTEEGIPAEIINEFLPAEEKAEVPEAPEQEKEKEE
jgi:large subunit ribosomal protein L11